MVYIDLHHRKLTSSIGDLPWEPDVFFPLGATELSDEALQPFALRPLPLSRLVCEKTSGIRGIAEFKRVSFVLTLQRLVVVFVFHPRGAGEVPRLIFAGYVPLASQSPYPLIVYSVANYSPILVIFGQVFNFRDPS